MSQQYDNRLSGALFVNDRKNSASQPDYRGSVTDETGKEYWVSAWIKAPRGGGAKFLSLALTEKDAQPARQQSNGRTQDQNDFLDQNAGRINDHRQQARDSRGDMAGTPQRPGQPQPAADFDSFDDDIPF